MIEKTSTIMFSSIHPFGAPGEYPQVLAAKLADLRFQIIKEMRSGIKYEFKEFITPLGAGGPGGGVAITLQAWDANGETVDC